MKRFIKYAFAILLLSVTWAGVVFYGTLNGCWHKPITKSNDTESFITVVNENIKKEFVGNFAMAIMKDGKVEKDLTQSIAGRYKDANSQVNVKIFEGKSHFICGEPGWEKVADYILSWYESL